MHSVNVQCPPYNVRRTMPKAACSSCCKRSPSCARRWTRCSPTPSSREHADDDIHKVHEQAIELPIEDLSAEEEDESEGEVLEPAPPEAKRPRVDAPVQRAYSRGSAAGLDTADVEVATKDLNSAKFAVGGWRTLAARTQWWALRARAYLGHKGLWLLPWDYYGYDPARPIRLRSGVMKAHTI